MKDDEIRLLQKHIGTMAHSELKNYIIPGLSSFLVGGKGNNGLVRMFDASREQLNSITPHSHRYSLFCLVLSGEVWNDTWSKSAFDNVGEEFQKTTIVYNGKPGQYSNHVDAPENGMWCYERRIYVESEVYFIPHDEIHSIKFVDDAKVLVFEGPQVTDTTHVLFPLCDGMVIDTLAIEPWMFQKGTV